MAKLIIDIYMSKLVDFSTILKFGEIISQESDKDEIDYHRLLHGFRTHSSNL